MCPSPSGGNNYWPSACSRMTRLIYIPALTACAEVTEDPKLSVKIEDPAGQTAMRGGLAWIDLECQDRFDKRFLECSDAERAAVLDDVAWPQRAKPEHASGVAFFNSFRDLTASGFWSSKMGVDDLKYVGNTMVPEWKGCPEEALKKLGL